MILLVESVIVVTKMETSTFGMLAWKKEAGFGNSVFGLYVGKGGWLGLEGSLMSGRWKILHIKPYAAVTP